MPELNGSGNFRNCEDMAMSLLLANATSAPPIWVKDRRLMVYMGSNSTCPDPSSLCLEGTLDCSVVAWKIVSCDSGIWPRVQEGQVVKDAGAIGVILENTAANGEQIFLF